MTHASRFTDDEPVALAKHAIKLLEARIATEFDLDLPMGAELEFSVLPKDQHAARDPRYYGVRDSAGKVGNHSASAFRFAKHTDPWFPESRRVAYSYREEPKDDSWDMLEVVLTHRPAGKDGVAAPQDALMLAREVEALRYQLHDPAPGHKAHRMVMDRWQDFRHRNLDAMSFAASVPGTLNTNGMHLNVSFIDRTTGLNALEQTRPYPKAFVEMMQHGLGHFVRDNLYLVSHGPRSIDRLGLRVKALDGVACHVGNRKDRNYIENAVFPADANPYYAMMLQLAGIYGALKDSGFHHDPDSQRYHITNDAMQGEQHEESPRRMFRDETVASLKERYESSTQLRDILNSMEPTLGDRFADAIAKKAPGLERSAMDKRHPEHFTGR